MKSDVVPEFTFLPTQPEEKSPKCATADEELYDWEPTRS